VAVDVIAPSEEDVVVVRFNVIRAAPIIGFFVLTVVVGCHGVLVGM